MKLLAIETAFEACSVALSLDGELIERHAVSPRAHAELVLPWVDELVSDAGVALHDLDAIAFSRGPGSFTSLRIGISVVQGLAWGAGLPVVPVSSLQATAQAAADDGIVAAIVAMDARMNEVYCGTFRLDGAGIMVPAGAEAVCGPSAVCRWPAAGCSGVGNGFVRYADLRQFGQGLVSVRPDTWPMASCLVKLATGWLRHNEALPPERAQPVYLRDKVAEKSS